MNEEELILDPVFMSRQTGAVLQNPLMGAVFALIRPNPFQNKPRTCLLLSDDDFMLRLVVRKGDLNSKYPCRGLVLRSCVHARQQC